MKRAITMEEIREAVREVSGGYEAVEYRALTTHPSDWYLQVVRAYSEAKQEHVVWLYNAEFRGLFEGYYTRDEESAVNKFNTKS